MVEATHTVTRCYSTGSGFMVVVRGRAMSFPISQEVKEGASVNIIHGRAIPA